MGSSNASNHGAVSYVHGPGMDQPLAVLTTAGARVLNYNWRGLPESSVWADGTAADCALVVGTCSTTVEWPSRAGAYYRPALDGGASSVVPTWLGSLTENGAGASGLLYRRNRYYDPVAGRFTRQDPIGLGGGLNAYGFAAGDPITYSDPFGLC